MTDEQFLMLNYIYLRKIATAAAIGDGTALPGTALEAALSATTEDGTVMDVGGQYMLSEDGTQQVLGEYSRRYAAERQDPFFAEWYERFEILNGQFLTGISAWQRDNDPGQLDRLLRLVERQIKALDGISGRVAWYGTYRDRFERALERVDEGRSDYVVSPSVDSIHNIWFEFHEDILTLLGRPRDVAEAQT
jgi:hypothetical protein